MTGEIIAISIFTLVLIVLVPTLYGFIIGAPLLYSPKKAVEKALKAASAKPGEKFYDLGMGSGRAMIVAANNFGLEVFGFELSPIICWLARINLLMSGVRKPNLYLCNFYKKDLSGADIIFCFLTPPAMEKLKPKFKKELKKGTRIISYSFRINGWQEHLIINSNAPGKVYLYIKNS
jgi:tRNA A58 N-methylase Trm61